ncbi:MAG: ABC transporter permease, partial [Solirubrobacterales bacterium]|nr:ABC transporter permease [Solirubrobacterales bacterium]
MGRPLLIWRLVAGDIRRRRLQSALLVAMIAATSATLTLSLALRGVTTDPFARTRAATKGPEVSALFEPGFHGTAGTLAQFLALRTSPGVIASSGPYPVARLELSARGSEVRVHGEGRNADAAAVDQPLLTAGHWTAPGAVVIERGFAAALGLHVGDEIRLNGRRFAVSGIALTAGMPTSDPLIWLTRGDLASLTGGGEPLWSALNLKLSDQSGAGAFADAHNGANAAWFLESWQGIRTDDSQTIADERQVLGIGAVLLALIAVAGI